MRKLYKIIIILVILAAILALTIPFLVVGFLLQTTGVAGGIGEDSSKALWNSEEPFGIIEYGQIGTELTLRVINNTGSELTLESIEVMGKKINVNTVLSPNQNEVVKIGNLSSCVSGQAFYFEGNDLIFTYSTLDITSLVQIGTGSLVGTCS